MALPTLSLEIGFNAAADVGTALTLDDLVRGKLDTGTLGPDPIWTDVTADLRAVDVRRPSTRLIGPITRYEAGTATFTLRNDDRQYDPSNLDGPYVSSGATQVTPMRAIRLRATWNSVTYDVWRGFVDAWHITYAMPHYSEISVTATDAFKVLASVNRVAAASPVGAGETTGTRVGRILDSAGWPTLDRIIDTGSSSLLATDLSGDALSELQSTAAGSELGELYIDPAGRVRFRQRHASLTESRSVTSQHTFGLTGGLMYSDLMTEYDDAQLVNVVHATRDGGTTQTATNTTSVARYLTHSIDQSGLLLQTDDEVLQWANWVLYQSAQPELRLTELVVQPQRDAANLFPVVLGIELGDRITVQIQPPGGGDPVSQDVFVRGIAHTVNSASWRSTFTLQSALKGAFMVLNNATLGQLDNNALAF